MASPAKKKPAKKAAKPAARKTAKPSPQKKKVTKPARRAAAKATRPAARRGAGRLAGGSRGKAKPKSTSRAAARPIRAAAPKKAAFKKKKGAASRPAPTKAVKAPARPRGPRAHDILEEGINALYGKDYKKARKLFEKVLSDFPSDLEVSDRARNYVKIVAGRDTKTLRESKPERVEDLVDAGVLYHNQQNYEKAIEYFNSALRKQPNADYIFFALASTYCRMGDADSAVRHLRRAVELEPRNRILARNDPDFEPLRSNPEYTNLLGADILDED
ncbi:MAG: tetratricopeptide repeat protein [Acidobacteriota bacterium]